MKRVTLRVFALVVAVSSLLWAMSISSDPVPLTLDQGSFYLRLPEQTEVASVEATSNGKTGQRRELSTFVWRQPQYRGDLTPLVVERLFEADRAWALETRLSPEAMAELRRQPEFLEIKAAMKELGLLYIDQVEEAKRALRDRPDRYVLLESGQRESDPRYGELQQIRAQVEGRMGAVWGDWDSITKREIHYVVLWEEFPEIRKCLGDQTALAAARKKHVGSWIVDQHSRRGMHLFASK